MSVFLSLRYRCPGVNAEGAGDSASGPDDDIYILHHIICFFSNNGWLRLVSGRGRSFSDSGNSVGQVLDQHRCSLSAIKPKDNSANMVIERLFDKTVNWVALRLDTYSGYQLLVFTKRVAHAFVRSRCSVDQP